MFDDEIVKEIRRVREEYFARFNHDLMAVFKDLKAKEVARGTKVFDFSAKKRTPKRQKARSRR